MSTPHAKLSEGSAAHGLRGIIDSYHGYLLHHALLPANGSCLFCRELGWEAATERMLDAGSIGATEWPGPISTAQEAMAWSLYNSVTGTAIRPPWPLLDVQMCLDICCFSPKGRHLCIATVVTQAEDDVDRGLCPLPHMPAGLAMPMPMPCLIECSVQCGHTIEWHG